MAKVPHKQPPMLYGRNAAIARILSSVDGAHVGMGIVIGPRRVLTCAHVVNQALGLDDDSTLRPRELLLLEFPLHAVHTSRMASVSVWHPMSNAGKPGDVAVLTLGERERDIDLAIGTASFASVKGRSTDGDPLSVYGILGGERTGEHVNARFIGFARASLAQVESTGEKGRLIRPGFSGAAVFDEREQAAVGMAQSIKVDSLRATLGGPEELPTAALMLPTAQLAELVPDMLLEERARPAWFAPVWSLAASALLVFSVAHAWVSQGGRGWIAQLALESRHPQIAALYGLHVIALLGLLVVWLLQRYARDFRYSHWSQRIPPFPFCRDRWAPGPRQPMSAVVIALFVVAPIYAQGHLLRKFDGEGYVYAHVSVFGRQAWGATGPRDCVDDSFCMHPDAGRYSLLRPAPGAPGGYFDYAYKYGEPRKGLDIATVSFFPGLQPGVILLLNGWSLALLGAWARLLCRPRP